MPIPRLDDRAFEEIVDEARSLIPRHARQWTDHNLHDPGITFIELFAWLAEIQQYRLDQVTRKNKQTFLKLLGLEPKGIEPAQVQVRFDPDPGAAGFEVPPETQILPAGKEEFVFQTREGFFLTASSLKAVISRVGERRIDQSSANQKVEIHFAPFGEEALPGSALELRFEPWIAEPQFHLTFRLFEDDLPPPGEHGDEPPEQAFSHQLDWEYWLGSVWQPLSILQDNTLALTQSGWISFRTPQAPAGQATLRLRCRLAQGRFEISPRISSIRLNTVTAYQEQTVLSEDLRTGSETPGQTVRLKNTPLLGSKAVIQVLEEADQPFEWTTWEPVEDFSNSAPESRHYRIEPETGQITFGNGLNGRLPRSSESIRAERYSHSKGSAGNLPAGQRWRINRRGAGQWRGVNLRAAHGGGDAEAIEEAQSRARKDFRSRFRAVTLQDYQKLALQTPGLRVARVHAIANRNPAFPALQAPGSVTLVVVPHIRPATAAPIPGPGFLETVQRHLESHRLVTTQLHVVPPLFVTVSAACRLHLQKRSDPEAVRRRAGESLQEFLDPFRGGPQKKGWPFGRPVFPSEIYQLLDGVKGVDRVTRLKLRGESESLDPITLWPWTARRIDLPSDGLALSGRHELEVFRHDGSRVPDPPAAGAALEAQGGLA